MLPLFMYHYQCKENIEIVRNQTEFLKIITRTETKPTDITRIVIL